MASSKQRAPKKNPKARRCWVCGHEGGQGFTTALRLLGYNTVGTVAHAHFTCIQRIKKRKV
jgi:hypothetical protein